MNELLILHMIEQAQGYDRAGGVSATDLSHWLSVSRPTAHKYLRELSQLRTVTLSGQPQKGRFLVETQFTDTKGTGIKYKYLITKFGYYYLQENIETARNLFDIHKESQLQAAVKRTHVSGLRPVKKAPGQIEFPF